MVPMRRRRGPEVVERPGGVLVERHNLEPLIELEQPGELSIAGHLPECRALLGDHGEPATHAFLHRDDGHADGFRGGTADSRSMRRPPRSLSGYFKWVA
jgi:hypothetical protein